MCGMLGMYNKAPWSLRSKSSDHLLPTYMFRFEIMKIRPFQAKVSFTPPTEYILVLHQFAIFLIKTKKIYYNTYT